MKKIFFITASFALSQSMFGQEPSDALRFSWSPSSGTARQLSVGGSGGSLGGDISSLFMNPAGIGFYKTGDFVITPGFNFLNNKATYYGREEKDKAKNVSFGTTGFVLGGPSGSNNGRSNSSAFAIAINRTADFRSQILYRGINTQSSYSQKFLEEISNRNDHDANSVAQNYPFGTSLAFNTYWIDTANGWNAGNRQFVSLAEPLLAGQGLIQEQMVTHRGGITELALGGASNFNEKFYVGATLGIPFLHYGKESVFTEADASSNALNGFDFASITENLTTNGFGVNLKLGVIYKPVEHVRLGIALHSPTYFSLKDRYSASVVTNTENYQGQWDQHSSLFTGGSDAEFKYALLTPYKIMASGSYVLREIADVRKQKGFITADIEFVNHRFSAFSTSSEDENSSDSREYLKSLNKAIDKAYKGALNFRLGGELKFTVFMVRLGGAYYGNPYKNIAGEKGHRFQLTGGLGYRDKGFFIDLGYAHTMGKDVHFPYRLQNAGFSGARIRNLGGLGLLTVGFKI